MDWRLITVFNFICFVSSISVHQIPRKQLAGPPSEFKLYSIPQPNEGAQVQESTLFSIRLVSTNDSLGAEHSENLIIDSNLAFSFGIFSPHDQYLELALHDPEGNYVPLDKHGQRDVFPLGETLVEGTVYRFDNPLQGTWKLHMQTSSNIPKSVLKNILSSTRTQVGLLLWNFSPIRMYSRLNTYNLEVSEDVGVVSMITDKMLISSTSDPEPLQDVILSAQLDVTLPDGFIVFVPMKDDGLHSDGNPDDGIYGAYIPAVTTGIYKTQAVLTGKLGNGVEFIRSTQHIIAVVDDNITLGDLAFGPKKDEERMEIDILVQNFNLKNNAERLYRAYAEVHATDSHGNVAPACWISSLVHVDEVSSTIKLELNLKWLKMAQLTTPLFLHNVYVQDSHTWVPLSQQLLIPVIASFDVRALLKTMVPVTEITKEMKVGKLNVTPKAAVNRKLLLTHGYCAPDNPWEKYESEWTDPIFFKNLNANINNQQFAEKLYEFVTENGVDSFGVVAHSQGGLASTHLLNYFQTGMDEAIGDRLIQSVGSPYLGSSGAGTALYLAGIFGVGCGSNFDISVDGAKLWLAGISVESRKQVYFYTTTYSLDSALGDYCSLTTNSVLKWPNDGATELANAQLPDANPLGNTEKECHSTDMRYDAQYYDVHRIQEMNKKAKR